MLAAVVALLVAITPNLLPFEIGLFVLILGLMAIYRPEQVVKATGGPSLQYRALHQGRGAAAPRPRARRLVRGGAQRRGPGTGR